MNKGKIILFLLLAFGLSGLVGAAIHLLDIRPGSVVFTIVVALLFMPTPALATLVVQKLIYKALLAPYGLRFKAIRLLALLWLPVFTTAIIMGALGLNYLLGNAGGLPGFGVVDFSPEGLQLKLAEAAGGAPGEAGPVSFPFSPVQLLLVGLLSGVVAGFTFNLPIMLGEELGWRGFLFEETKPLGFWRASLLIGVLWGLWHAPVILVGHNYPGQGLAGVGMMVLFCLPLSVLMSYVRVKVRSVWGPVVLHGIINATGPVTLLFIHQYNPLLGGITGLAGILAFSLVTAVALGLDRSFWRQLAQEGFGGRKPVAAEEEAEMVR